MKHLRPIFSALAVAFCIASAARASSLDSVAKHLAKGLAGLPNKRVAVLTFPYHDGSISSGSSIIAERLTTLLVERHVQVIERSLLDKTLSEMKLEMSGVTDPSSAQKLGQVLGVDAIVTGTLIDLEQPETEVNARLIRTGTGEILAAATTEVDRTWKDLPRPPVSQPTAQAKTDNDDNESHLHMSPLIPTHPAHQRPAPTMYVASSGSGPEDTPPTNNGTEVLSLTNADLVPVEQDGETNPAKIVQIYIQNPETPPQAIRVARRIYHRNPNPNVRAQALLAMGLILERQGHPQYAARAYQQVLREFPEQVGIQDQARRQLASLPR